MKLTMEEPPDAQPAERNSQIQDNLKLLVERQGRWGRIAEYESKQAARQTCYHLRSGQRKRPAGEWEFQHGPVEGADRFGVWARYLGPPPT